MTLELTRPNEPMASGEAGARLRLSQVSVDVKALKRSLTFRIPEDAKR